MALQMKPFEQAFPVDKLYQSFLAKGLSPAEAQAAITEARDYYEGVSKGIHDNTTFAHGMKIIAGGVGMASGLGAVSSPAGLPASTVGVAPGTISKAIDPITGLSVAGGGGGSTMGSILNTSKRLSPILGDAAKSRGDAQQINDYQSLQNANYELKAPGERLKTGQNANRILHGSPVKAQWGGPGSGQRGEMVRYEGGYNNPALYNDPQMKQLAQSTMDEELRQSQPSNRLKAPGRSSAMDKILGGVAFGTSILGGLRK